MYFTSDQEIKELVQQFETKTLSKICWTHRAHLVVALYYLYTMGSFYEVLCKIKAYIIAYNEATGGINSSTSGYHETLTVFWLKIVDNYLAQNKKGKTLVEICNQFLASPWANKDLPLRYYSSDKLFSIQARAVWTIPDRKPL